MLASVASGPCSLTKDRTSHRKWGSGGSRVKRVGAGGGKLAKLEMLMRDFCSERCKEGFIMLSIYNKPA